MLRRSLRILRTSLTVLSLVLFVVVTLSWFDSYWHSTMFNFLPRAGTISHLINGRGRIELISRERFENELPYPSFWRSKLGQSRGYVTQDFLGWTAERFPPGVSHGRFLGFGFLRFGGLYVFLIPHWSLALLFGIAPTLKLRAILRARKQKHARGFEVSLTADERR